MRIWASTRSISVTLIDQHRVGQVRRRSPAEQVQEAAQKYLVASDRTVVTTLPAGAPGGLPPEGKAVTPLVEEGLGVVVNEPNPSTPP